LGGKVSCTLGEVKNRADFVVFWGGNPAECHPRHFTKYSLTPKGRFVPEGRKGRTVVLVDIRETPSAKAADIFLQVRPGKDFEVLSTLRALVKGQRIDEARVEETGLTMAQMTDLVDRMKKARFGVMFFGMGLSMTRGKHMNSGALLTLAAEMNAFTKFVCMPMRGHGNVTGADMVLRSTTGYPFGVNLSRGYPRFNPGEYSTVDHRGGPGRDDAPAGYRAPGPHSDDRAGPQGHAHEPSGARAHYHGDDRCQRSGNGVPNGRNSPAAASRAQVAVSDR
jgi:formylmethanofuran dehydrogenase subunit B